MELKRAKYLLVLLQTLSPAEARKASCLSAKAHNRLIKMFMEKGDAYDSPRSGRPQVYTPVIMEVAYEVLTGADSGPLTGRKLKARLVAEGVLHETSDEKRFMEHLREYITSQGRRLITNSMQTTFYITRTDVVDRLNYASVMMGLLANPEVLRSLIYVDEVTLEESPHPKGRHEMQALLTIVMHQAQHDRRGQ